MSEETCEDEESRNRMFFKFVAGDQNGVAAEFQFQLAARHP